MEALEQLREEMEREVVIGASKKMKRYQVSGLDCTAVKIIEYGSGSIMDYLLVVRQMYGEVLCQKIVRSVYYSGL